MSTITILDANGTTQTVAKINATGQAPMAESMPVTLASDQTPVITANVTNKFREAFESYTPNSVWAENKALGDIIQLDGNAAAASYLVISKDPLSAGTESTLGTLTTFTAPFEAALGLHMSQRTLGQEFSSECVSTESPLPFFADVAIASISQGGSTLTVTTATPHNLAPGMRIGIRDCVDSRMNYQALVVATTPATTQFTCTAGPMGVLPAVTAGPFTSGYVYIRSALGYAPNGTSMIFENAVATNASFYVRAKSGDALPSASAPGSHAASILSTASFQAITAAATYAFQPTNEYRLSQFIDGIQWSDVAVDSIGAATSRYKRTQVVPDHTVTYILRFRAVNSKSLTIPNAQIVSATKTGTATATIITATPHGLTTSDLVNVYGLRDQTNFPNLTVATAITSIINATTFTIAIGGAVTATTYGGYVSRVNGGQVQQGAVTMAAQSVARTSNIMTLVGSASWSGVVIGDYLNLVGIRDNTTGASLGVDGPYRVRDIQTTSLILDPIGNAPTGANIATTNCGGGVIKRTDLRISFARILDFERQRIEMLPRPAGDSSTAMPVVVNNTPSVTATVSNGQTAHDGVMTGYPVRIGGRAVTANFTPVATGDATDLIATTVGVPIQKPYAIPEAGWNASVALTTTTATALQAAAAAGLKRHITALQAINTGASVTDLIILDGATERWRLPLPVNVPVAFEFPTEIQTTAATALNVNLGTAVTSVRVNAQGYTAP